MANAVSKIPFSAASTGNGVKIAATATPGTTVHTTGAVSGVTDEVWLYFYNSHTTDVIVTIEYGGATAPDQNDILTVPFKSGLVLAIPGLILTQAGGAQTVKVFAATTNVVIAYGYVMRITA